MIRKNILSRGRLMLFIVAFASSIVGCLSDPIQPFQVRPELVVAPPAVKFSAPISGYVAGHFPAPPSGSMLVTWRRSVADTQLNFKGYFVELWTSDTSHDYNINGEYLDSLVDTASILRSNGKLADTFYTFKTIKLPSIYVPTTTEPVPLQRYTVTVHGLKSTDTLSRGLDSAYRSIDSTVYSNLFDPLPMENPTNLRATSSGPNQVTLRWTDPITSRDTGFYQYVIYYKDTTNSQDSGHFATAVPKAPSTGGNDSTALVTVPPSNIANSTTSEWPYQFWVKSERIDSTFSFGPDIYGSDTNHIEWAGSERVPKTSSDSLYPGYLLVPSDSSVYFGSYNGQYDLAISSTGNSAQMSVSIANGIVTMTAQSPNGVAFYDGAPQPAISLDSIFYAAPIANPSQFTSQSVTLPQSVNDSGAIVYLMMNDDINKSLGHQWARIFIRVQPGGSFVDTLNTTNAPNGGIDIKASFQPGVWPDGSQHLPFY